MASRKQFAGFAQGITSRFVSRNNDIGGYWGVGVISKRLHDAGRTEIEFDLLSGAGSRAGNSAAWLEQRMVATATPKSWLSAATLRVVYTPRESDPSEKLWPVWIDKPRGVPMFRVIATAVLVDDHGRTREASSFTWCWDHNPDRELPSGR